MIVTGFNGERRGFLVDHVEWIHRISWSDPSEVRYESGDGDLAIKSVVPAADGEEARTGLNELIECASPPDIVVIDIEMPRMDGSKLTKRT